MGDNDYMPREGIYARYQSRDAADLFSKVQDFEQFVLDGRARGDDIYTLPVVEYRGGRAIVDCGSRYGQRELVVMCSADYLGLAHHPDIITSGVGSLQKFGTNVASVPVFGGTTSEHKRLERSLAEFIGAESGLLFPTGYAANMGAIQALCAQEDTVVLDKLCHYSILDGVSLSRARRRSFRHSDPGHLEEVLSEIRSRKGTQGILVVVEGVYGIDGDVAPLDEIAAVASRFDARIMIDEAHALGVIGPEGRGTARHHGIDHAPDIVSGSLSKALACPGGFIACDAAVADYVRYFARTNVFSVGLQTACVSVAEAAVSFIRGNPWLTGKLKENSCYLRTGLERLGLANAARSESAIMSVIVGSEDRLREVSRELFLGGVWAEALPFPAVPMGEARIRFRVSAAHAKEDLDCVLQTIEEVFSRYGLV